jgi:hypothetical protein
MEEDKQLERLYDYTKFHIGIYLSAAGGLTALIAALAKEGTANAVTRLIGAPWALGFSFIFIALAGVSGAIVATSAIQSTSYQSFLSDHQGAYGVKPFTGQTWVTVEHGLFWLSLVFLSIGIFSSRVVLHWLFPCIASPT